MTDQAVRLSGSGAAAGAEEVAALPRLGTETAAAVALCRAVDLGEPLAVLRSLSPAPILQTYQYKLNSLGMALT